MPRPVNLIADKLAERTALKRQILQIAAVCSLSVFAGVLLVSGAKLATARAASQLQDAISQQRALEKRLAYLERSDDDYARTSEKLKWAGDFRSVNQKWSAMLSELGRQTPDGVFLTQIRTEATPKGQSLRISGTALSLEEVATFISSLSRSPPFDTVLLESMEAAEMNGVPTVNFHCLTDVGTLQRE